MQQSFVTKDRNTPPIKIIDSDAEDSDLPRPKKALFNLVKSSYKDL